MPWKYSGRIIRVGKAWVDNNGTSYPAVWNNYSADEKAAIGLTWEDEVAAHDNRFYWGRNADGNQLVTLGLKSNAIALAKAQAASQLAPYDWYVTRKSEKSTAIPSAVSTYRDAVRTACAAIETSIGNASDLAAFMALYDTPVDSDGEPTGKAPINDWPDEI